MYRGQKFRDALNIFKWMRHGETSLTSGLLSRASPEIELSDYHRFPSSGSESPSELLNGEGLIAQPISDLDLFFGRIYSYYCEKGLWCIVIKWMVELLSLGFVICFSGFFLLFVDWNGLRNAKCGINAVESGTKPCDLAKEALHLHPFTPLTTSKCIIIGYLVLFSGYWIFCFLRFFVQLKDTLAIRRFYSDSLHISDSEVQTMQWASVLEKVVQVQRSQQLCVVKDLSAHDVVMRIMRKENYLIGMLNKGVLAFPISRWVPGTGPAVSSRTDGMQNRLVLNNTLQWALEWCILHSMFDRNFFVKGSFISHPSSLKMMLTAVGIGMLVLSPFIGIFMLVRLFLKHAEQFYNHPSTASSRRLSTLSKWMFREFNEVDHLFRHRINSSVPHACDYLKQFPSPVVTIIAKFISFVSGGFAAVLIIIAFLEESLLEGQIYGRNLLWYAAVFGTVTAISRALVADELQVLDPEGAMSLVVQHTHFMPKRWRSKENTDAVRTEFETLFQYTGMMLLEEMASIILTPYLLLLVVPKRVDDILQFISDFTVDVDGVGHVCSLSVFDFERHGNNKYASPHNASRSQRSSQGKLEKSFLSFQSTYPFWEPNADGKKFISNLRGFGEHKLQVRRNLQQPVNFMDQGRGYFTRDVLHDNNTRNYLLGSLWSLYPDQKNHPYLLDWYYTCWPSSAIDSTSPPAPDQEASASPEPIRNSWFNNNNDRRGERFEDDWGYPPFEGGRVQSHYEASSSNPNFRDSVIQHGNLGGHHSTDHWWGRTGPHNSSVPQGSFLDPPTFGRPTDPDNLDRVSESEQEQGLDRMNSSSRLLSSYTAEPVRNFWMDNNNTARQRDNVEQSECHSEASSSNPNLLGRHQNYSPHWLGRNDPNSIAPQTSFMEPPLGYGDWRRTDSINIPDNISDRNSEEEEDQQQYIGGRNPATLSKTFYMGNSGAGVEDEFKLPFEDIHQIPPLKIRIDRSDSMTSDW